MTDSTYRAFKAVLLVGFFALAGYAMLQIGVLARDARISLAAVSTSVDALVRPTQQLEANWSAVAKSTAQVVAKERDAFGSQQAYFEQLKASTAELTGKTSMVLVDMDTAVKGANDDLAKVGIALDSGDRLLADTDSGIGSLVGHSQESLSRLDSVVDPAADSMTKLDATMSDVAATAADARAVSDHYTKIILAPASKAKAAALFVASIAGRVLRIL